MRSLSIRRGVLLFLLLMCVLVPAARAETEGFTYACESGMCFWRRPIVEPPPGWARDDAAGAHFRFNAFARKGEDFTKANAVLYANAVYRKNGAPSLAEQIARDKERILQSDPKSKIGAAKPVQNADAKSLATFTFIPSQQDDSWETVAYDEEGDYYLRFVLSAQTKEAHDKALPDFVAFVRGYSRTPKKR
jgi:hypothetical protein